MLEIDITVPVWLGLTFGIHWVAGFFNKETGNYYLDQR